MTDETHIDGGGAEQVFRLIYRSHSLVDADDRTTVLGDIFNAARRNNRGLGITGALVVTDDTFVQTLEGDESAVRELFASISRDSRHDQVSVLEETSTDRIFGRWAMARVSADGGPDIRLLAHAGKGGIVAAPKDPSITPAQETLLAYMRGSIALDTLGS